MRTDSPKYLQLRERIINLTLTEWLLLGILFFNMATWSRVGDLEDKLQKLDDSLSDVRSSVSSESSDVQGKLDEIKEALDGIAANQ